jgi:hypothetical protein
MKEKHYLNLTNGIEFANELNQKNIPFSFLRMQSSHCESHSWDLFLQNIDHDLLMHLALGYTCYIYDCGSRGTNSTITRAIHQGIELLKFTLHKEWHNKFYEAKNGQSSHFKTIRLDDKTKKRIKYYRKFIIENEPLFDIIPVCKHTLIDGKYDTYKDIIYNNILNNNILK